MLISCTYRDLDNLRDAELAILREREPTLD
jgi:hypothetical protein